MTPNGRFPDSPSAPAAPEVGGAGAARQVRLLAGVMLADVACFGIVVPLLASYAAATGAGPAAAGILVATYSVVHLAAAPVWGRVSDRIGRRPVLLLGVLGTILASLLFAVAETFPVLLLSQVVSGGLGASLNVSQAWAADLTTPERRTRAMGLIGAAFGMGFVVGPALAALTSRWGNAAPGLVAAGIATVNLAAVMLLLREPARRAPAPVPVLERLPVRGLAAPYAAAFASTLAFTVLYVAFPLHAESALGYDRSRIGGLFALIGLVAALVQGGMAGRLARRIGEPRMVIVGGVLMAAGLGLLPRAADPGGMPLLFLLALAAAGAGLGLTSPAEAGYVSRITSGTLQGRALGFLQSVNAMSRIAGPIAAGLVMQVAGAPAAFTAAAVAGLVAAAAGVRMRRGKGWRLKAEG